MKKWIALLLALLLAVPVAAAEEGIYETAGDLYAAWAESGEYPDYICGVWSTDGSWDCLTFAVRDDAEGEAAKAEILALVRDDDTVSFECESYAHTYNELRQIQSELDLCFDRNVGLIYTAVDEMNNCVMVGINEKLQSDPETVAFVAELQARYGNVIMIEYGSVIYTYTQVTIAEDVKNLEDPLTAVQTVTFDAPKQHVPYGWIALVIAVPVLVFIMGYFIKKRRTAALVTTNGETLTGSTLSTGDVARMVKEAAPQPSAELDEKILSTIHEK